MNHQTYCNHYHYLLYCFQYILSNIAVMVLAVIEIISVSIATFTRMAFNVARREVNFGWRCCLLPQMYANWGESACGEGELIALATDNGLGWVAALSSNCSFSNKHGPQVHATFICILCIENVFIGKSGWRILLAIHNISNHGSFLCFYNIYNNCRYINVTIRQRLLN